MNNAEQTGNLIKSVDKAMQVIEVILQTRRPMSLNELSIAMKAPKSTLHAILATLREHSFIEQQSDGKYFLGIRLFECGCAVSAEWNISQIARPHLVKLAELTGASSFIAMLDRGESIIFDRQIPPGGMQVMLEQGSRHPLNATSQGKVLLSGLPEEEYNSMVGGGLKAHTRHTITEPEALAEEMERVRQQGYAIENGEYRVGLRSVAAPVYDRNKQVKYAVGVVGLFSHINSEEFQNAIQQSVFQARQISVAIGYRE